jgi:hypothetical protein
VSLSSLPANLIISELSYTQLVDGDPSDTPRENTHGVIYDPTDNSFGDRTNSSHDMFCSGVSMLDDGRVFIAGGGKTVSSTSLFTNGAFSEIESLTQTCCYPSSTTLASG